MDPPPSYTSYAAESSRRIPLYTNDHVGYTPYERKARAMEAIPSEPRVVPVLVPAPHHPNREPQPLVESRRTIQVIVLLLLLGLFGCLIGGIIISKRASAVAHVKILR
jgi:hypothetical protein